MPLNFILDQPQIDEMIVTKTNIRIHCCNINSDGLIKTTERKYSVYYMKILIV